jgi:K+-sensing histidine kinase KdpD
VGRAPSSSGGGFDWTGLSAAGARQLIHELRTPLSAIYAYAEMIEGQLVGPVSSEYREIAAQIIADARELVGTFDDLDMAGRIARNEERGSDDLIDLVGQLRAIVQRFASAGSHRITLETMGGLPPVSGDREQIERMLTHLVRAGYAALEADEPLVVRLRHLPVTGTLSVSIQRPTVLRECSEAVLLDHASPIDQMLPDAPPLGLAFALRLVRGIAGRMGGQLLLSADAFELMLPAATRGESEREQGS